MVRKKEFTAMALNPKYKTFVIYVASFTSFDLDVHPYCRLQIVNWISSEAAMIILAMIVLMVSTITIAILV